MNFTKVFRRQHHHKEVSDKPSHMHHHGYPRPFSYHIPPTEPSSPLNKPSQSIPYRVGLSSDSAILTHANNQNTDEIVRLPSKPTRQISPKQRKDRRHHGQLTANKRWLFRSMEALDEWKGKVFSPKIRTNNTSQTRSQSADNLADGDSSNNRTSRVNSPQMKQQRISTPNRSFEAITNRVINSIGIHRKSTQSVSHPARSPTLTIKKQTVQDYSISELHNTNSRTSNHNGMNSSTILDFRELSSLDFLQSQTRSNDPVEHFSSTTSENRLNDFDSSHLETEDMASHVSLLATNNERTRELENQLTDSSNLSMTWLDSLKEQNSPERKIQFYENLIQLLEKDTLNIDELLVLRKILAKIWPNEDPTPNSNEKVNFSMGSRSVRSQYVKEHGSTRASIQQHTPRRYPTNSDRTSSNYESLHELKSGQPLKSTSLLISATAKPCLVKNDFNRHDDSIDYRTSDHNYPMNNVDLPRDSSDPRQSTPIQKKTEPNADSIRRYFERLTLLETIYEKLNLESNRTLIPSHSSLIPTTNSRSEDTLMHTPNPVKQNQAESKYETQRHVPKMPTATMKANQNVPRFIEMNVDGNNSISSGSKSSLKRRAPKAPHIAKTNSPAMFALTSTDVAGQTSVDQRTNPFFRTEVQQESADEQVVASCNESGQIFVYDPPRNTDYNEETTASFPRTTARIQQWLSSCEVEADGNNSGQSLSHTQTAANSSSEVKIRCVTKQGRSSSRTPTGSPDKRSPKSNHDIDPGRYRTCLKIQLDSDKVTENRAQTARSPAHTPIQSPVRSQTTTALNNYSPCFRTHGSTAIEHYNAVFL